MYQKCRNVYKSRTSFVANQPILEKSGLSKNSTLFCQTCLRVKFINLRTFFTKKCGHFLKVHFFPKLVDLPQNLSYFCQNLCISDTLLLKKSVDIFKNADIKLRISIIRMKKKKTTRSHKLGGPLCSLL